MARCVGYWSKLALNSQTNPETVEEVDYYTTQMLSGNGCFNSYLHKIKRNDTAACQYGEADVDDAHVL